MLCLNWLISLISIHCICRIYYNVTVNGLSMKILKIGHNFTIVPAILSCHIYFPEMGDTDRRSSFFKIKTSILR